MGKTHFPIYLYEKKKNTVMKKRLLEFILEYYMKG